MSLSLNLYQSMALAVAIFYFGAFLKSKISVFRTYCIPSPVIGGIIYAIVNLILYQTGVLQLSVDTTLQSVFMNVFFTSVGFTAGFGMLKKGGKSLIVFLVAVCILIGILVVLNNHVRSNAFSMYILSLWCEILGYCELDCTSICERLYRLDYALAESLSSNNNTFAVILYCSCKYFRSTCTVSVDKNSQRHIKLLIIIVAVLFSVAVLIFCVYNKSIWKYVFKHTDNCC